MRRNRDKQPPKTKKYFRPTKKGAGMTKAGVARYRRENPGSKLKTAVTGKVKKGSKAAKRRKSFCARSAGQMKKFPKAAKNPNSRLRQARRRWKCQMAKHSKRPGLWANIHAKRKRIKTGSGERMRKPGSKGAPTKKNLKRARSTSKRRR